MNGNKVEFTQVTLGLWYHQLTTKTNFSAASYHCRYVNETPVSASQYPCQTNTKQWPEAKRKL